jgi:transposase
MPCGACGGRGRRSPDYDKGAGRRQWRGLDVGTTKVFIEPNTERVQCRAHGPSIVEVPWPRHDVGHTRDFDAMAVWLAVRTSKSATCQLLRVARRMIGSIITRVNDDFESVVDRLDGLRWIRSIRSCTKRGPADAMDEMFGTIPTTVTDWRGTSGGWVANSDIIQLSETQ